MNYAETLAYLYAQLPIFQRIGKAAYKADLCNTVAMMDLLGHPEKGLKCVHVAGTNGKGSTCHLIASVLQEAGYKVGLHTSPHLKDLCERFRINGRMVPHATITEFVEEHRSGFEPIKASFFEWGVAFAVHWFRQDQVDIAVMETGMGGRLDSTNVVNPEVSVITNIGWDHMDLLGNTLEAIAMEKAGIIKTGIPVVVGEADGAVADVLRSYAEDRGSPITFVDQRIPLTRSSGLVGSHQVKNVRTALAALHVLDTKGWNIPEEAVNRGLRNVVANTGLAGRWQILSHEPLTVADVAHNADGIRAVRAHLATIPYRKLSIVLGMVNDKDTPRVIAELPTEARYFFCKADIPRGMPVDELRDHAASFGLSGTIHGSVRNALLEAKRTTSPGDLILITGSVFVVAEVI